jgi:hypothetical protein
METLTEQNTSAYRFYPVYGKPYSPPKLFAISFLFLAENNPLS